MKLKILVVMALMACLGWYAGNVKSNPQVATDAKNTTTVTRVTGKPSASQYHSVLLLDQFNHGGPGELFVHGVYKVKLADPMYAKECTYTICVNVRDMQGNTVIDRDPIGIVTDRPGRGNWEEVFEMKYDLPKGDYMVDMVALPQQFVQGEIPKNAGNGGFSSRRITVW